MICSSFKTNPNVHKPHSHSIARFVSSSGSVFPYGTWRASPLLKWALCPATTFVIQCSSVYMIPYIYIYIIIMLFLIDPCRSYVHVGFYIEISCSWLVTMNSGPKGPHCSLGHIRALFSLHFPFSKQKIVIGGPGALRRVRLFRPTSCDAGKQHGLFAG